ncbi:hypothetical protein PHYPSEUDO_007997 [Phytophthora pseudosyringae]|uniref:Uncharacterized protein n=1 Tax=Phytophthora pseudosyringae TaxID=221518 RepID=A0A8T1VID2_9STRA|nr:hypothetical protein PHYPSEUDO_007997 [Phytophthora pseudosyringae]
MDFWLARRTGFYGSPTLIGQGPFPVPIRGLRGGIGCIEGLRPGVMRGFEVGVPHDQVQGGAGRGPRPAAAAAQPRGRPLTAADSVRLMVLLIQQHIKWLPHYQRFTYEYSAVAAKTGWGKTTVRTAPRIILDSLHAGKPNAPNPPGRPTEPHN